MVNDIVGGIGTTHSAPTVASSARAPPMVAPGAPVVSAATRSPGAQAGHAVAHREHGARELETGGEGERGPLLVPALAHEDVGEVEPGRRDPDDHLTGAGDRIGHPAHLEHVGGVADRRHLPRPHGLTLSARSPCAAGPSDCPGGAAPTRFVPRARSPFSARRHPSLLVHRSRGPVRTYTPKPADIHRAWHVVDADGAVLGRLAVAGRHGAAGQAQADLLAAHGHRRPRDRRSTRPSSTSAPASAPTSATAATPGTRAGSRRRPSSTCSRVTPSGSSASPSRACSRRGASAAA